MNLWAFFTAVIAMLILPLSTTKARDYPLPPHTAFALPKNSKVRASWLVPSSENQLTSREAIIFAVSDAGEPWLGIRGRHLYNPLRRVILPVDREMQDFVFLRDREFVVLSTNTLGFLIFKKEEPTLKFIPILELPSDEGKLFRGEQNRLYILLKNKTNGEYEIYRLTEKGGRGVVEKIFATKESINDLCESGNYIYIASGWLVLGLDLERKSVFLHYKHKEPIREIECFGDFGIFYATDRKIGFIGKKNPFEFAHVDSPQIILRKNTLYILLKKHLGIIKIDNVQELKNY
ncbi:MAG: hypothetical protein NZ851_01390 [Aquificaceae bacterium]|nr:hypothetical protein [Aquificaceae bacterium]